MANEYKVQKTIMSFASGSKEQIEAADAYKGRIAICTPTKQIFRADGEKWEEISNHFKEMPTAAKEWEGVAITYIGETTDDYKQGSLYLCVKSATDDTYSWKNITGGGLQGALYQHIVPLYLGKEERRASVNIISKDPAPYNKQTFIKYLIEHCNVSQTDLIQGKGLILTGPGQGTVMLSIAHIVNTTTFGVKFNSTSSPYYNVVTFNDTGSDWKISDSGDVVTVLGVDVIEKEAEPAKVIDFGNKVKGIVTDETVTIICDGMTTSPTIPAEYRPQQSIWFTSGRDWTNFGGVNSLQYNDGKISTGSTPVFGTCTYPRLGHTIKTLSISNSCRLIVGEQFCTLISDGGNPNFTLPIEFAPKFRVWMVCSTNWTAYHGVVSVGTDGVVSTNGYSGQCFGSVSWQYREKATSEMKISDNRWGGRYTSTSSLLDDNKFRVVGNNNFNNMKVVVINKHEFNFSGNANAKISAGNETSLGTLYFGKNPVTCVNVVSDSANWQWSASWGQGSPGSTFGLRGNGQVSVWGGSASAYSGTIWFNARFITDLDLF